MYIIVIQFRGNSFYSGAKYIPPNELIVVVHLEVESEIR